MPDLAEFLRARLDDDQAIARFVEDGPGEVPRRGLDPLRISVKGEVRYAYLTIDPARVLAEVDAKRRIIEWAASMASYADDPDRWACPDPDDLLRALALPYADHPDYDPGWKP